MADGRAGPRASGVRTAEILLDLGAQVASALDLDEALSRGLDSLARLVSYDSASIFLLDGDALVLRASRGFPPGSLPPGFRLELSRFPLDAAVLSSGEALVLRDVREDPRWFGEEPVPEVARIRGWMGVPLVVAGRSIGMLAVDSFEAGGFGPEDLALARALAGFTAVSVENARLFAESSSRLRELDAVKRVVDAVGASPDADGICLAAGPIVKELAGAEIAFVALFDAVAGRIRTHYFGSEGDYELRPPLTFGRGLTSWILESRQPLYLATDEENRAASAGAVMIEGVPRSWLGLPLLSGGEVLGVLSVQSLSRERAFPDEDRRLLGALASTVAARIQNARLLEDSRRRAREAAALAEAGREISESLEPEVVLQRIAESAMSLLTEDTAAVYLDDGEGTMRAFVAVGLSAREILDDPVVVGEGIIGRVAATGRAEIVNDTSADPLSLPIPGTPEDEPGEKLMAVPLREGERVLGVMAVWRGSREAEFRPLDLEFLTGLSRQAAVAIQNARLHRRATEAVRRVAALYEEAARARAEAEEANRLKSRFLASMSHELRTPLNSIINFAFLLLAGTEGDLAPGQSELLSRIEDAGTHLLGLINDVLDLAKIESGRMELSPEELEPGRLVAGVVATASALLRGKPVELRNELPEDLPAVRTDRTRFRQILLNLLSNAAKFTERGSIVVSGGMEEGGRTLLVQVRDTGIGMRTEDLPKAFAEFVQLDGDLDRRAGGSGLGLPLARRFAELLGGSLEAESEPGRGSVFALRLPAGGPDARAAAPARAGAAAEAGKPGPDAPGAGHPGRPPRVLVLDGDPGAAAAIAGGLSGYRVDTLGDPAEAAGRAARDRPDLVILDVMMPGVDGWEVLRRLKSEPATASIPVVMCTVLGIQELAASLGASAYVAKPFDLAELRAVVARLVPPGGRVLAVDDDDDALEIVKRALSKGPEGRQHG